MAWIWMPSRPEEPVYQGKTLSEWLKIYITTDVNPEEFNKAGAAVRKIGTNGIPTLLRMIRRSDSNFKKQLKALAEKQDYFTFEFEDPEFTRALAFWGFVILRDEAIIAVPELITLVKHPVGDDGRTDAIAALGTIGPSARDAVPSLMAIAGDPKDPDRWQAFSSLIEIRSSLESVVPVLVRASREPDENVRRNAVIFLSKIGRAAQLAAPALIAALSDPSIRVRETATNALRRIDPAAAAAAGVK